LSVRSEPVNMSIGPEHDCRLYVGTGDGLRTARLADGELAVTDGTVEGNAVRAISVHPDDPDDVLVGCGLRGWGLYHTTDGGATATSLGFDDEWVWGLARHPRDPDTLYVGTEPPMVYRSTDGGGTFEPLEGVGDVPSRGEWTFFHEPFHAGHVHGFAVHPDRPERVVAGVEHGAVVATHDGGETWHESLVGSDVHRLAVHPSEPDRVYAATGSGLHRSDDGGRSWEQTDDLSGAYLHALVFHPEDHELVYAYAASEDSPVHLSDDGGETWQPVAEELPSARPADTLRLHPADPEIVLYAGDVDQDRSHLFVSADAGETWERLEPALPKTWRLEAARSPTAP
jgi:photosystem II stability/assembly factor-like uncharacterized protein